jgi:hypothetical protein
MGKAAGSAVPIKKDSPEREAPIMVVVMAGVKARVRVRPK